MAPMTAKASPRIVVLTGAGISRESGLATFREPGGVWDRVNLEDVATPEAFRRDPDFVHSFYNARRAQLTDGSVRPNAAHTALARLARERHGEVLVITQNIDDLHDRAGQDPLIHMHGELLRAICTACRERRAWHGELTTETPCPACGTAGTLRPDVVWFGEMPLDVERILAALHACETFVAVGTSAAVQPAASFVHEARSAGARCVEVNLEPSEATPAFHDARHGPATELVPTFVAELLGERG